MDLGKYTKRDGSVGFCGSKELKSTQYEAKKQIKLLKSNLKCLAASFPEAIPERTGKGFGKADA